MTPDTPAPRRASRKISIWCREDAMLGGVAALVSFAVYAWTAAPNVTLLDSGEFVVAAQHFGVPHPTGYPLWTILSWLFQLLPLGNPAWEINLFSGVCAAVAVGLGAMLLSNIQAWCFAEAPTGRLVWIPRCVTLSFSLMLAFSESMWSQAVIAEVYALQALLVAIFLMLCYSWVRHPGRDGLMLAAFFVLALAFSNHHLIIALTPLPYLLILLLRRRAFLDWLFAGLLTALLGYLGFAILSREHATLQTAIRLFWCVALAFGVFLWHRRLRVRWKLIAFLPFVIALGLLPYAYMPLASSTNPPMNWGYTRTAEGFFFSFNRSQYSGSLSSMLLKSVGRLVGTKPDGPNLHDSKKPPIELEQTALEKARAWIGFFWFQLSRAFTPVAVIGYFASILFVFRFPLAKRVWIYLLHFAFVLAAFLQPATADTTIDRAGWWTQMPYHTYTNLIFAVLAGLGIGLLLRGWVLRRAAAFWLAPALLVLPIFTLVGSAPTSSQRGHWFGWMFGYDMLHDLPQDSIVIGGTDPGRFVPTYMIFGESTAPVGHQRAPFDRRDLYIITQNALGEKNYMDYLRDQYTARRPKTYNAFERWLGRDTMYPKGTIILPTDSEVEDIVRKAVLEDEKSGRVANRDTLIFGAILRWIWEKNKDRHPFYIEESFPLQWTYDYAVPHGLIYRMNPTPLESLPPDAVEKDFAYWKAYKDRLLGDPAFRNDFDAQRSFSKLRQSIANIYAHRKMDAEAERAYREALELSPSNMDSALAVARYCWNRGDFAEAIRVFDTALKHDPNNIILWRLRFIAEDREAVAGEIRTLEEKLARQPRSSDTLRALLELYSRIEETNKAVPLLESAMTNFADDADTMRLLIAQWEELHRLEKTLAPARQLVQLDPSNFQNYLLLSRALFLNDKREEFYTAARRAIELGGRPVRDAYRTEAMFSSWTNEPEYKAMLDPDRPAPER